MKKHECLMSEKSRKWPTCRSAERDRRAKMKIQVCFPVKLTVNIPNKHDLGAESKRASYAMVIWSIYDLFCCNFEMTTNESKQKCHMHR